MLDVGCIFGRFMMVSYFWVGRSRITMWIGWFRHCALYLLLLCLVRDVWILTQLSSSYFDSSRGQRLVDYVVVSLLLLTQLWTVLPSGRCLTKILYNNVAADLSEFTKSGKVIVNQMLKPALIWQKKNPSMTQHFIISRWATPGVKATSIKPFYL